MGYSTHNFQPGQIIRARNINEMDAQIVKNMEDIEDLATNSIAVDEDLSNEGLVIILPVSEGA